MWAYHQWHKRNNTDYDLVYKDYLYRSKKHSLPVTWVAFYQGEPVGMVTLKRFDLATKREVGPWLSALYVMPSLRKKGAGSALIGVLLQNARKTGFKRIYLFADRENNRELVNFYKKRGWYEFDRSLDLQGYAVTVMSYNLQTEILRN